MTQKTAALVALADNYDRMAQSSGPTLDVILILRRQKWPLVLGALIGLGLALFHYTTSPKTYYAVSNILISEQTNTSQEELSASVPVIRNETTVLNEMQVLRSLQLGERVVAELDLHKRDQFLSPPVSAARKTVTTIKQAINSLIPAPVETSADATEVTEADRFQATALTLQKDVGLQRVGRTFAIEISYIHNDPDLAADIVNAYAKTYLQDRQIANLEAADRSAGWLQNHIDEVRENANSAATEAEVFRKENGASNVQVLRQLEQRAATLNNLHTALLARYEMIAIEGSYPITNGRVLSTAIAPTSPALPKAWRILSVGLVLGLMGGFAFAAWRETRETAFRAGFEIRELAGLPFLGYLNKFKRARLARLFTQFRQSVPHGNTRSLFRWLPIGKAEEEMRHNHIDVNDCAHSYLLPVIAPDAPYCETIKNVLATLNLSGPQQDNQVIAVASLNHGEGRSTVAANIAQLAALEGQRVLLIDADLSNPELSRQFGFHSEVGLHDILAGRIPFDDAIFQLPETGLSILPGRLQPIRSSLATAGKLPKLIDQARQNFETIIIDFQPLGVSSDLKANLPCIDSVVLLAEWGRTSKQSLLQYTQNEPQLHAKTVGVLLNQTVTRKLPLYDAAKTGTTYRRSPGFA